jgi:hypothetical protein
MAWWAVLFALSMLARYQPAARAAAIDVNSSEYATALEHRLYESLTTVPGLVLEPSTRCRDDGRTGPTRCTIMPRVARSCAELRSFVAHAPVTPGGHPDVQVTPTWSPGHDQSGYGP